MNEDFDIDPIDHDEREGWPDDFPDDINEEIATEPLPELTAEQQAYRFSHDWVQRCARDTVKLHLDLDRWRLLWLRMRNHLPHLRGILEKLQTAHAAAGVTLTEGQLPEPLRQERVLAGLIQELEEGDYHTSQLSRDLVAIPPATASITPARARVTLAENGAWEVHAGRSELELDGARVDYWLSAELAVPKRFEIPAYAIMTEADR